MDSLKGRILKGEGVAGGAEGKGERAGGWRKRLITMARLCEYGPQGNLSQVIEPQARERRFEGEPKRGRLVVWMLGWWWEEGTDTRL
jgi:hypothetical protein